MGLVDYQPFRAEVTSGNQSIVSVRGLSFDDLSILVRAYMPQLDELVKLSETVDDNIAGMQFLTTAINAAPNLIFDMIALAADEPSYSDSARKLPMGLQVKIMRKIIELTVEDIGGPNQLIALVQGLRGKLKELPGGQSATPYPSTLPSAAP